MELESFCQDFLPIKYKPRSYGMLNQQKYQAHKVQMTESCFKPEGLDLH